MEVYIGSTWMEVSVSSPILDGGARGVYAGGTTPSAGTDRIGYVTISTLGSAAEFGDLTVARFQMGACSSRTRAVITLGEVGASPGINNTIDYVTISSTGDAIDFGDDSTQNVATSACGNQTRGLIQGGYGFNTVTYITIATTGNALEFGD